ncbi:hypothetical protein GALMADRAFT_905998 [Galerina marginata CBS 339.88]|uniref:BTB domain-containing protein n=1 Tax=Galerina marginata (strain CBS 339.88) TaxID=685588 RepID=A0A067SJA3_GALM3|nr:hypothetical protein GALMADRAFT_905998 [Galerina marginata CBS 339.88]
MAHFTPNSFFSILSYIYTGALKFTQHETNDELETAFDIYRGSIYLRLPVLQELIMAYMSVELLHGLFHARLIDSQYSQLVNEKWKNMAILGCRCQECARRTPRVLRFTLELNMRNDIFECGARRAMIGLFGEGWYTEESGALPWGLFELILDDIREIITAFNVFPLLFQAEKILPQLIVLLDRPEQSLARRVWAKIVSVRDLTDEFLYANAESWFASDIWKAVTKECEINDGPLGSKTLEQVNWVLKAILRGAAQQTTPDISHDLVDYGPGNSILAREFELEMLQDLRGKIEMVQNLRVQASLQEELHTPRASSSRKSSASVASFYSTISTPTTITFLEKPPHLAYNNVFAFNASNNSLDSIASSRTVSTDYGLYYTRWAISQETVEDDHIV